MKLYIYLFREEPNKMIILAASKSACEVNHYRLTSESHQSATNDSNSDWFENKKQKPNHSVSTSLLDSIPNLLSEKLSVDDTNSQSNYSMLSISSLDSQYVFRNYLFH